jgi:hypothetical protein
MQKLNQGCHHIIHFRKVEMKLVWPNNCPEAYRWGGATPCINRGIKREGRSTYVKNGGGAFYMGFSGVFLTMFTATLIVDSGILAGVPVMSDEFPQVTRVLRHPPTGGGGEMDNEAAMEHRPESCMG